MELNFFKSLLTFDQTYDFHQLRVARSSIYIYLTMSALTGLTAIFRIIIEGFSNPAIWVLILTSPLFLLIAFYTKKTRRFYFGNEFTMFIGLLIIIYRSINTGGIHSSALTVIVIIPIVNSIVCGSRSVMKWTILSSLAVLFVYYSPQLGIVTKGNPSELVNTIVLTLLTIGIGLIGYTYVLNREEYEKNIIQFEKQIIQNEKYSILGTLASGVAHQINNPLAVIELAGTTLSSNANLSSDHNEMLNNIQSSQIKIAKIVTALRGICLNLVSDNKDQLIADLIAPAKEFFHSSIEDYKIDFIINIPKDCQTITLSSEYNQIFVHLIQNSITALKKTNSPFIKIEIYKENHFLICLFSDNGIGINKNIQKKIFHPFFSQEGFSTTVGMGLAIVDNILKKHNANIEIASLKNNTIFKMSIPI